jgi:Alginate export
LYKHENGGGGYQREEESNIHTIGFHVKPENKLLWLNLQMVGQFGNYGNFSRSGFGTMAYGGIQFKTNKSAIKIGPWYMFLSGDDPSTQKFEGFNNLFGGYPNDDELYLNTWARESGTSMWTNINLIGAFAEYRPTARYNIRFWYHYMLAPQNVPGSFFGNGNLRGQMIMIKVMADISKKFKAYYMFEYLWPGNFYFPNADNAILSRINLEWYF